METNQGDDMRDFTGWEEVEEDVIKRGFELATEAHSDDRFGYQKILAMAELYREADLTPIFVFDAKTDRMTVYAEELYGKKLN